MRALAAELRKAASLPAVWVAGAVAAFGSGALTALNAVSTRNAITSGRPESYGDPEPVEIAFAALPLGVVAAVVIGVVVVSSEYTPNSTDTADGRQITATLTAVPRRTAVLLAKAVSAAALTAASAVLAIGPSVLIARLVLGDLAEPELTASEALADAAGATLYWILMGMMALAITVFTRSGIVPLVVLIVNGSLVSVSFLLTRVTDLAHWLPDMAGRRLFPAVGQADGGLDAVPGALVMAAWAIGLLVLAGAVFACRDA